MLSEPIPVKSRERSLESSSQGRCPPGSNDNINVDFASYCLHGAFLFLSDIVAWNCILSIMYTLGVDWVIELFAVIGYSHDVLLPRSSSISRSTRYSLSQKCYVGSVTKPPPPKKKKEKKNRSSPFSSVGMHWWDICSYLGKENVFHFSTMF